MILENKPRSIIIFEPFGLVKFNDVYFKMTEDHISYTYDEEYKSLISCNIYFNYLGNSRNEFAKEKEESPLDAHEQMDAIFEICEQYIHKLRATYGEEYSFSYRYHNIPIIKNVYSSPYIWDVSITRVKPILDTPKKEA